MTPHNRVLVLVGGSAIIASLTIGTLFVQTGAADASLQADQAAALSVQSLGDELLGEVQEQRHTLAVYLLSADPKALALYRQAAADEASTAGQIGTGVQTLSGLDLSAVTAALDRLDAENDAWRAGVAEPAIVAVAASDKAAVMSAVALVVHDLDRTQASTTELLVHIDALQAELDRRSAALNGLRIAAIGVGLAIELLAACLSLWFVRRYGLRVTRDTQRRIQAGVERGAIVASLRTLHTQPTSEGTAMTIAQALHRLPGIDVAGVYALTDVGLRALAIAGLDGFPVATGDLLPDGLATHLRERSDRGPWAERLGRPEEPDPYHEQLHALGYKGRAFAPLMVDGELIGLIGVATTDAEHSRHLVDDLPAVGEFATVAESILAPAMMEDRVLAARRKTITALVGSAAFRPVYQPIVELASGLTVGFEALTRFDNGSRPDEVFAAADLCGMGLELEAVTLEAALVGALVLPEEAWLSVNVSPAFLAEAGALVDLLTGRSRPIVLEVTEHQTIPSYARLHEVLERLGPGIRLAVDDAGAGIANFNHLVELRPDFVKIDIGLVRGVDADPSRRAVVAGLVHFAAQAGCQVLAEGIETQAELATVIELGVTLGQGYVLAKPADAGVWITGRGLRRPRGRAA